MHFRRERRSAFPTRRGTPFPQAKYLVPMCISCFGCIARWVGEPNPYEFHLPVFRRSSILENRPTIDISPRWGCVVHRLIAVLGFAVAQPNLRFTRVTAYGVCLLLYPSSFSGLPVFSFSPTLGAGAGPALSTVGRGASDRSGTYRCDPK